MFESCFDNAGEVLPESMRIAIENQSQQTVPVGGGSGPGAGPALPDIATTAQSTSAKTTTTVTR